MQIIQVFHNPAAGDADITKEKLLNPLEKAGYTCRYLSTKDKNWKKFDTSHANIILIAGGDGTVRKVCRELLKKDYPKNPLPIALIPAGTANNLGKSLKPFKDIRSLVNSLQSAEIMEFGLGKINNLPGETFFMESFGYGIFPYLMQKMDNTQETGGSRSEELNKALKLMHQLVEDYKPRHCKLRVDGVDHSGDYLLAEVMNIKSIGPNLFMAPGADPADDVFEVVMVGATDKKALTDYLQRTLNGDKLTFEFIRFRGADISISWDGTHVHVDDQLVELKKNTPIRLSVEPAVFRMLVAGEG